MISQGLTVLAIYNRKSQFSYFDDMSNKSRWVNNYRWFLGAYYFNQE